MRKNGWVVVEAPAIRLVGPNSSVVGYPDLIVKRPDGDLEIWEVKTGMDPPLTDNQMFYIPMMQLGGHIYSTDPRVAALGITPGAPFPPIWAGFIYAPGPNQPYKYGSFPPPEFVP